VWVDDFKIGKYPVTVKQWKQFVKSKAYKCAPDSPKGFDNHPAHDVLWRDAHAFCEWLTGEWRRTDKIGGEDTVRLPTEAEWEKAARGTDKWIWSWGNKYDPQCANIRDTGIGFTCAVGCFPDGGSPYCTLDMIGNVWEWTLSKKRPYPYAPNDGREQVDENDADWVLRGGSFFNLSRNARCAVRGLHHASFHSEYHNSNYGFRVVVVSPQRSPVNP
jgi:iron(II)-dependent oxidoreductase